MNFLTIQDGEYSLNLNMISEIEWLADTADVKMVTGTSYTLEGEDFDKLKQALGV